jgi:hypothetical protein
MIMKYLQGRGRGEAPQSRAPQPQDRAFLKRF